MDNRRVAIIAGGLTPLFFWLRQTFAGGGVIAEFCFAFAGGMCLAIAITSMLKIKRQPV